MIERHCRIVACKSIDRDAGAPLRVVTIRTLDGDVHEIDATTDEYETARRALANKTPLVLSLTEEGA